MRFSNFCAIAAMCLGQNAMADTVVNNCTGYLDLEYLRSPIEEHFTEVSTSQMPFKVRLQHAFVGEPISSGSYVLLHLNSDEYDGINSCHLIHNSSSNDAYDSSSSPEGFNDAEVSKSIHRFNETTDTLELFIPVSEYPFALEEDHKWRMLEVNISKSGDVTVIAEK